MSNSAEQLSPQWFNTSMIPESSSPPLPLLLPPLPLFVSFYRFSPEFQGSAMVQEEAKNMVSAKAVSVVAFKQQLVMLVMKLDEVE